MSKAIDRLRAKKSAYARGMDQLQGDDGGMGVGTYASLLSELTSGAAGMMQMQSDKDAAARKGDADKGKDAEHTAALKKAADQQKAAQVATIDARTAMTKADAVEVDKNGPQHVAARRAADNAALLTAQAKGEADKAALLNPAAASPLALTGPAKHGASTTPSWVVPVAIGAGALGLVGILGYLFLRNGVGYGART